MVGADSRPTVVVNVGPWDVETWRAALSSLDADIVFWPWDGITAFDEPYYLCAWKAPAEFFRQFPEPKAIISLGAGVDHILDTAPSIRCPVVRIVSPSLTARMVEYVSLAVIYLHRQVSVLCARQQRREWIDMIQPQADAVTVGILGLGVMGQACAKALQAIGYRVCGWSRTRHTGLGLDSFSGPEGFQPFLQGLDVLCNLLPATAGTRDLIGTGTFQAMTCPGLGMRYFINAGRGETVREPDLISALETGLLGGAVLDVFAGEPLDAGSVLWGMDNVLITPHIAANSDPVAIVAEVAAAIAALEAGRTPANIVDVVRGY